MRSRFRSALEPDRSPPMPDLPSRPLPDRRALLAAALALAARPLVGTARAQEADAAADPRLNSEAVSFQLRKQFFRGQLVRLRTGGRRPGILLIHDQRGVDPFFRGLARRLALDGFVVMLPDLLSPYAVAGEIPEEAQSILARIVPAETMLALDAAADLLVKHPECTGSIAALGFIWGGTHALQFALQGNRVKAAVAYYAVPPAADRMVDVKVPVLFHWSENDPRTAPIVDVMEKRMIGAGRPFEAWTYADTRSGFASEPADPRRWDKVAADRAYERTVFFLKRNLLSGG